MIQLKNRPFAGKAPTTTQQAEFSIGWRFCPVCGNKLYQKIEGCSGILQVKCNRCKETLRLDSHIVYLTSEVPHRGSKIGSFCSLPKMYLSDLYTRKLVSYEYNTSFLT